MLKVTYCIRVGVRTECFATAPGYFVHWSENMAESSGYLVKAIEGIRWGCGRPTEILQSLFLPYFSDHAPWRPRDL
jgi:hypothetical protein